MMMAINPINTHNNVLFNCVLALIIHDIGNESISITHVFPCTHAFAYDSDSFNHILVPINTHGLAINPIESHTWSNQYI